MKIRYAQFAQAVRLDSTMHLTYLSVKTMPGLEMTFSDGMLEARLSGARIIIFPPNIAYMEPENCGADSSECHSGTEGTKDSGAPQAARTKGKAQRDPVPSAT